MGVRSLAMTHYGKEVVIFETIVFSDISWCVIRLHSSQIVDEAGLIAYHCLITGCIQHNL